MLLALTSYLMIRLFFTEEEENIHKVRVVSICCSVDAPTIVEEYIKETLIGDKPEPIAKETIMWKEEARITTDSFDFETAKGSVAQTPLQKNMSISASEVETDYRFYSYDSASAI